MVPSKGDDTLSDYLDYLENNDIPTKQVDDEYFAEVDGRIYKVGNENTFNVNYVEKGTISEPRISKVEVKNKTNNTINIDVESFRMDGGTYTYYISTDESDFSEAKGTNTDGTFTFTNLEKGNTYYIKVVGETDNGTTSKVITQKIPRLPDADGSITYAITWSNGVANVSLETQSKYNIESSLDDNTYSKITTRNGLQSGTTVYARLTDGTFYGDKIEIEVVDNTAPNISLAVTNTTTKSITVNATATDTESGISGSSYTFYIAKTLEEIGTVAANGTSLTGEYTFDNLEQNTTYYIKAKITDKAENTGESEELTGTTKLIPSAETSIARNLSWAADGTVKIALSTEEDFTIQYSLDRTTWQNYLDTISAENNSKVYVVLTDGLNYGEDYELVLADNEGPNVEITKDTLTTNSIKVNVNAVDSVAGMPETPQYNYYIKQAGSASYTQIATNVTSNTYTFTGLTSGTSYNIKVTTSDILGNVGTKEETFTTPTFNYSNGNISFSSPSWSGGKATVTLTNNTSYNIQYKVVQEGETMDWAVGLTTTDQRSVNVTNLLNNYSIYARLYDGTNYTTGYANIQVTDTTAPTATVSGNPEQWQNTNVTLTVNAEDNESGLANLCYSFDNGTTWQASNTKEYEENTSGIVIKVKDVAGNVYTNPSLNITKIDKTGPVISTETETTPNTITVTITDLTDAGVGAPATQNITYKIAETEAGLTSATSNTLNYSSSNNQIEFTDLTQSTTYYIELQAQDSLGNVTTKVLDLATGSLNASTSSITITDPTWSNQTASVSITNSSTYKLQYQVVTQGNTFNVNSGWTTTEETTVSVTNLNSSDTVYARLTDDTNYSSYTYKQVIDETAPTATISGNPNQWQNTNVTLTISAEDNESGLAEKPYSFDRRNYVAGRKHIHI